MLTIQIPMSELTVRLSAPTPIIAPEMLLRIEEIWQREKARRGKTLFNSRLFSIDRSAPDAIAGWMTEYRYFLAQRRDPSLYAELKIRPLAVTGVLCCKNGIVFGRRADQTEMDAKLWELVPSGSVDDQAVNHDGRVSLERSILIELHEEIGIRASEVLIPSTAFALVEDSESHVTDAGLVLKIDCSGEQILEKFSELENREYSALKVVAVSAIPEFRRRCGTSLSQVSGALLDTVIRLL